MQNGESNRLPDLPPSSNKFWDGAKKFSSDLTTKKPDCEHYFIYRGNGREIACRKCSIGYYLSAGAFLKDGQIVV